MSGGGEEEQGLLTLNTAALWPPLSMRNAAWWFGQCGEGLSAGFSASDCKLLLQTGLKGELFPSWLSEWLIARGIPITLQWGDICHP
jgi:hypothetical protein